ncbi:MAG TPA: bifunctional serine/threonine-protein kinase/formylglycine-generating enzyme family protein [Anaerolineales bacterium]|nr:bifunctional serine/threonine-protein kinase/formylglycine-generating enzyme family protein [Anaerolineales bacterium]
MPEWIGKTIGKVRIEKLLARGGMAEVYLGSHLNLERAVAIKVLHSFVEEDPALLERFQREAKVVAGLRHPNIVQVFDFDTIDGHPYIVMEYLKGPTLANFLRGLHQRNERIAPHQVARLLKVLTAALDYAHGQGVIHRDIKPGNIILHSRTDDVALDTPLTNDVEAVITDFGLVRIMDATSQTASGMVSGTPAYMSPEQGRGDRTDHRTDIYSLGVVLYEMLAGRVPFEADSTMAVIYMQIHTPPPPIPGIAPAVQGVMDRALAKNPDERYRTSQEMAIDFYLSIGMTRQAETIREPYPTSSIPVEAILSPKPEPLPEPESQPKQEPPPETKPKPARSPAWIGAGLFSLVILSVLLIGGFRFLSTLSIFAQTTETASPEIPSTSTSPSPSEGPALPLADKMVQISAGTYEVGRDPADDFHSAIQNIALNDFWIDQYQTTNAEYEQYLAQTGSPVPVVWPGEGNQPVRGVTWDQAAAYCGWISKRLPNEAEWEASGRGPGAEPQLYPWGTDPTADGNALSLPSQNTYEVGSQSFNVSPLQVYDMVGNVWEWVGEPYAIVPDGFKVLRGGRYGNPQDLAYRLAVAPDDQIVQYAGFRCAADQVR